VREIGTLHVRGRRTGIVRTIRLRYSTTADGSVLIAAGGRSEQWPLNLRADPDCRFQTDGGPRRYRASELPGRRFRLDPV